MDGEVKLVQLDLIQYISILPYITNSKEISRLQRFPCIGLYGQGRVSKLLKCNLTLKYRVGECETPEVTITLSHHTHSLCNPSGSSNNLGHEAVKEYFSLPVFIRSPFKSN